MSDYKTIDVALIVTQIFERLGIPYLIGGSVASILYGMIRYTNDADIVADIKRHQAHQLANALSQDFFIYVESILSAIDYQSSFSLIHKDSVIKVDIFVNKHRPFDEERFNRRTEKLMATSPNRTAMVCTPEDIILAKLEWFRMGGEVSERQWRDVLGVIKVQADGLDEDYLRRWASVLRVDDLLERALSEGHKTE
jgi:hypothetical protein